MLVRSLSRLWQGLFRPTATKPPYSHVVQLGDPALRASALPVRPEDIQSPEVQEVIRKLVDTMRHYKCAGLAAPQIGVPLRIIAVEVTKNHVRAHTAEQVAARQMEVTPLRVLLNPELTVEDYGTVTFPEGCASVRGITGLVERYRSVSVSALTPTGEHTQWTARGWAARALQHEMDHLSGTLLLDRCSPRSLEHQHWQTINTRAGRYIQNYSGYRDRQWGRFW